MKVLLLSLFCGSLLFLIGLAQFISPLDFMPPLPGMWLSIICMCVGGGLLMVLSIAILILGTINKHRSKNNEG